MTDRHVATEWITDLLTSLAANRPEHFAGVGLLVYSSRDLPITPLVHDVTDLRLPTRNRDEALALLSTISRYDSRFHDGFHLVDGNTLRVTHVSQFFSPPIPSELSGLGPTRGVGARYMAAYLGSLMTGVELTAILSGDEGGLVFDRGVATCVVDART